MTNPFGGKNPHGLYVPMTDDELEVIARIAEARAFRLIIKDWGHVDGFAVAAPGERFVGKPLLVMGDKRLSFYFRLNFEAPAVPQPNWYFDMEVWAFGHLLFSQRMPTEQNGKPVEIAAGVSFDMALDITIDRIDPKIVKEIKPRAIGLTTRHGNMQLDSRRRRLLHETQDGERAVREISRQEAVEATRKAKKATGR